MASIKFYLCWKIALGGYDSYYWQNSATLHAFVKYKIKWIVMDKKVISSNYKYLWYINSQFYHLSNLWNNSLFCREVNLLFNCYLSTFLIDKFYEISKQKIVLVLQSLKMEIGTAWGKIINFILKIVIKLLIIKYMTKQAIYFPGKFTHGNFIK